MKKINFFFIQNYFDNHLVTKEKMGGKNDVMYLWQS